MLNIIKGDIFEIWIRLCHIDPIVVKKVVFSSKKLGIVETAKPDKGEYNLRIEGERTAKLPVGFASFDITVELTDGEVVTAKRNARLQVLEKRNEVKNE